MPDSDDQCFQGIALLDATKIVPEELVPVQPIGRLTLNRVPVNFFAEVEQVAFHTGHLVRGIEVTDDPLMQARLFSYLDTQLLRLGGPNFSQIPINRPTTEVNDNFRDGFHQDAVHHGRTPYLPNSVGGGCPFLAGADDDGYIHVPRMVEGPKLRNRGPDDPYAQARLFWHSVTEIEQDHIVDAYTFELGKVEVPGVVERMLSRLVQVDQELAQRVAFGLGATVPDVPPEAPSDAPGATGGIDASPALAMVTEDEHPPDGRGVHLLAGDGAAPAGRPGRAPARGRRRRPRRHPRGEGRDLRPRRGRARDRHPQGRDQGRRPTSRRARRRSLVPHRELCRRRRGGRRVRRRAGRQPGRPHLRAERLPPPQADRGLGR